KFQVGYAGDQVADAFAMLVEDVLEGEPVDGLDEALAVFVDLVDRPRPDVLDELGIYAYRILQGRSCSVKIAFIPLISSRMSSRPLRLRLLVTMCGGRLSHSMSKVDR